MLQSMGLQRVGHHRATEKQHFTFDPFIDVGMSAL